MTQYEISAIIGHWRNGASYEAMCYCSGLQYFQIKNIIDDYIKKLNTHD